MGGGRSYIHSYAETGSERRGKGIPGKTGSIIATSVCSLLDSSAKKRSEVTVLRVDHQNKVQKESTPSEFDARRWERNLSSLMVKGGDTRPWLKLIHTKCQAPASHRGRGHARPGLVEKPRPSWLSQRAGVPRDPSHYEEQEGLHRSCFYHEFGGACFSCS